jgi:hypothetical protein
LRGLALLVPNHWLQGRSCVDIDALNHFQNIFEATHLCFTPCARAEAWNNTEMGCRNFILFAVLLGATVSVHAAESPIDVVHKLTAEIRKTNRTAIATLYVKLNDRPVDLSWLDALLESGDNDFISPTWCPDSRIEGDASVVIVATLKNTGALDIDPCYLVRTNDKWLILPKHTRIDVARGTVSDDTMKSLESLKDWYTAREKTLHSELETEAMRNDPPPRNAQEARRLLSNLLTKRDPHGFPTSHRK